MPIPVNTPGLPLGGSNTTTMLKWLCFTALPAVFANQVAIAAGVDAQKLVIDKILKLQPGES